MGGCRQGEQAAALHGAQGTVAAHLLEPAVGLQPMQLGAHRAGDGGPGRVLVAVCGERGDQGQFVRREGPAGVAACGQELSTAAGAGAVA